MPMVVQNPYLTYSEENVLENCNQTSNMRAEDLSLFDEKESGGVVVPQGEGNI